MALLARAYVPYYNWGIVYIALYITVCYGTALQSETQLLGFSWN